MLQTLKQGMTGDIVKVAQYLIEYSKMNKANGTFDGAFFNAVKDWQTKNSLEVDGIIGSKTWKAIYKSMPTCSTSKNKSSAYTCAIQILVGGINVDGIYGSNTKKAVSAYQEAKGLEVDGICGPATWKALITNAKDAEQPKEKVINKCVHYLQWDSKWGKKKYSTHTSSQTIGNSGCGPTAMAQIMATWIDPKITPVEMCELALKGGYRTYDSGTSGGFFKYVFKQYDGFEKFVDGTKSMPTIKAALGEGALAVCCMNSNDKGFWTSGGHYITTIGYDSDGYIYANDPNKKECPRRQKEDKFKSCLKNAWIFWPKKKETTKSEDNTGSDSASSKTQTKATVSIDRSNATEIVDISKWQGTINFDEFGKKAALVIARVSCGSDKDVKIDTYASAMVERGIPFGVYCYSYAGTLEKARDEAQKMIEYAKKYKPLFYVVDAEEDRLTQETIKEFASELRKLGVKKVGCYVGHHHYKGYSFDDIRDQFDFIWIPRYGANDGTIESAVKPKYKCDLWQYTSQGKIAGIKGHADLNVITEDGHDLKWFLAK